MRTTIQRKLKAIEQEENIKILYACESGSRAWEFPSPDSDYDVRFIYIRSYSGYLSIVEPDDQLNFPINNGLDLVGWDLRKSLQLICKSNTTPFEWLQSPIVYLEDTFFRNALWELCPQYFSRRSNLHHYLGIARGARDSIDEEGMIKIKKLFYLLRPLLAARWCLERSSIAPMSIQPLMNLMPDLLQQKTSALIALKADKPESYMLSPDPGLMQWIEETFVLCSAASAAMDKSYFDPGPLNSFFRKTIQDDNDTGNKR